MWDEGASDLWGRLAAFERETELLDAVPTRLEGGVKPAVEADFQSSVGVEVASAALRPRVAVELRRSIRRSHYKQPLPMCADGYPRLPTNRKDEMAELTTPRGH